MKQKQLLIIGFSLCFLFLGACDATTESAEKTASGEKDSVRLASWSQPISEQINLLVDAEKHFFQENNLDITFIPGAGGGDAIKNILTGKADIAFTDPGSLFGALDKGEKLKVIYNIYPQNVFNVVSLKEKNITKPEDLKGKTIGEYSLSSGTRQKLLILLHQVGLTEADVNIVETGILNFAPLIQGQVDATAATDTGLFLGKQKGLSDVNVMEVKDVLNFPRSEEHTSELQSRGHLVCRLLLEKKINEHNRYRNNEKRKKKKSEDSCKRKAVSRRDW